MAEQRNRRRTIQGVVVSDKMDKSITVLVERMYKHPKYKKYMRRHNKHHSHDESNEAQMGDRVELASCRPLSKLKRWRLVRVVEKSRLAAAELAAPAGGEA
ncbi:MAG: small subunit ribosomal protein S17 [Planctomycetota bacterium]|jgi:small subunit ribosomal protein S17